MDSSNDEILYTEWSDSDKDIQHFTIVIKFASNLVKSSSTIDADIAKIINENFMDLLA